MSDLQPLGNLAQASRTKQLRSARWILIIVGILSALVGLGFAMASRSIVESHYEEQVRGIPKEQIDQALYDEGVAQDTRMLQVVNGIGGALGIALIICGVMVYRAPVPSTITGLIIYVGGIAGTAVFDPSTIARGIIIKVIVIICLVKAIQAAIAYQKESSRPDLAPVGPAGPPPPPPA